MLMNCSDTDTAPVCHQPVPNHDDLAINSAVGNRYLPRLYRFRHQHWHKWPRLPR